MFFNRAEDEVVKRVEERVAAWTMVPRDNAEGMQVLRYVVRGRPHRRLKHCGTLTKSWLLCTVTHV